jgi:type IV pilus assembly protein PilP
MTARALALTAVAMCLVLGACGGDKPAGGKAPAGERNAAAQTDAGAADAEAEAGLPVVDIQESEWRESERSRDPFRAFANMFVEEARNRVKSQREVVLEDFALDELKLVGIVLRADPPVAMLVDPTGRGHTIRRGQFVGRPDVVQVGQRGAAYEVNWRVDRIRDGDVVFVREDPQNPDVPSATKVIGLHPEGSFGVEG